MSITCLVLDCDGVILESMDIKTQAMAELATPYGQEAVDRLVMYHSVRGGVNRLKKFAWFLEEVVCQEYTQKDIDALDRRFQEIALEAVKKCPLVPGIEDVLEKWHGKIPLYVCSGAPHDELNAILQERNLTRYFTAVYGAPPAKTALLQHIVVQARANPENVLMVGDSFADLHAAENVGTLFYGRGKNFMGGRWPWAEDMQALHGWLEANMQ